MANQAQEQSGQETARLGLNIYIDVYKQHFDLFFKGAALYVAANGILAGIIFHKDTDFANKSLLAACMVLFSALCLVACRVSWRWVAFLESRVTRITDDLNMEPFPFQGAKGIIKTVFISALFLGLLGLTFALWCYHKAA